MSMQGIYKQRKQQDFRADLTVAQKVERATAMWLHNNNYYKKVKIVNEKGHDILCLTKNNKLKKLEVKRDSWVDKYEDNRRSRNATDNICIEVWSNFRAGNKGWAYYSDADLMLYIGNENIYIIDMKMLKRFTEFTVNPGKFGQAEPRFKMNISSKHGHFTAAHNNGNLDVRNVLFNKNLLIDKKVIVKILDREECGFNMIAKQYNI